MYSKAQVPGLFADTCTDEEESPYVSRLLGGLV